MTVSQATRLVLIVGLCTTIPRLVSAQATPPPQAAPVPPPAGNDWLARPGLAGDWGGARAKMHDAGVDLGVAFTQFFTSAPTSEDVQEFQYGNKLDVKARGDLGGVWKGLSVDGKFELRSGDAPLLSGGTLIPTNTALLFPAPEDIKARITHLAFTQVLNPHVSMSVGRFNTLDLYSIGRAYTGGAGIDRFMNLSFNRPPLELRTVPAVAEGVIFTVMRAGEPVATAGLVESTDDGFFANGATVLWTANLPIQPLAHPGHYTVGGTFSSTVATSLTQNEWIFLPPNGGLSQLATEQGAWTLNFSFDQSMAVDETDHNKHWGFFGMIGVSDGNPSPFQPYFTFGAGGNVLLRGRTNDTWGIAYYRGGVSNDLIDTAQPFRLRDEQGGEMFYNVRVAGWTAVTADLQFVDPFLLGSKTRTFFSVRWKIMF